jgi:DnaJ-domain-containing protein 1
MPISDADRPLFYKSVAQLELLFKSSKEDVAVLSTLEAELLHRRSMRAAALSARVARQLRSLRASEQVSEVTQAPDPSAVVSCANCAQRLRLALTRVPGNFTCPNCKAAFEVTHDGDVLSVVFCGPPSHVSVNFPRSVEDACRVLAVDLNSPWPDIERARRKLIQDYHPDRVQTLGARLRSVAEQEAKAINVAFEILRKAKA